MNEQNDMLERETGSCGPGCSCGTSASNARARLIAGSVVLLIAGVLVVRAMVKDNGVQAAPASTGFATLPAPEQPPASNAGAKPPVADAVTEIAALSELNAVAEGTFGVFVFLPGKDESAAKAPVAQMRSAARTIEPQLGGGKIGIFTLKAGSPDHEQIALQIDVPGVLALVRGAGMSAASGDITETKLVQSFVAASGAGGCGSGGCGPKGCN